MLSEKARQIKTNAASIPYIWNQKREREREGENKMEKGKKNCILKYEFKCQVI